MKGGFQPWSYGGKYSKYLIWKLKFPYIAGSEGSEETGGHIALVFGSSGWQIRVLSGGWDTRVMAVSKYLFGGGDLDQEGWVDRGRRGSRTLTVSTPTSLTSTFDRFGSSGILYI